ncbi:hypothetical protein PAPYR_4244 [Paratrimastix pyriformis]|uniref:Uncharacterized protein n=1 Tax=Paratrimastix pyriformis TaxID=342808 RepID=A0ABQ8UKV5_9EUKA|nr:hypothetical protein PAPYR_4244 [Paratrimastix pyriformis]
MGQIGVQPSKDNFSTASGISFGCFLAGSARARPCRHFRPPLGRPQVPVPMRQPLEGVDPRSQCAFLFDAHVPQKFKSVKFARKVLLNGIKSVPIGSDDAKICSSKSRCKCHARFIWQLVGTIEDEMMVRWVYRLCCECPRRHGPALRRRFARTLVAENVCFAGKNRGFGGLRVPYAIGGIVQLVLVARSGGISCDTANYQPTYWGCPWLAGGLSVMITDANDQVIAPRASDPSVSSPHGGAWYFKTGATATSPELRFDMPRATALSAGQQLRLWYGEDLYGLFEGDNGGVTCADLYADTEDAPGGPGSHPGGPLRALARVWAAPPTVTFGLELDQRPDLTNPACAGFVWSSRETARSTVLQARAFSYPEIRDCFGETTTGGTLVTEGYLVAVIRVAGQPQAYWAWKTRIVIDPVSQASSTYMSLNTGPAIGVTIPTPRPCASSAMRPSPSPAPAWGSHRPRHHAQAVCAAQAGGERGPAGPSVLLNLRVLKARLLAMPSDGSPADLSVRRLFAGSEVVQQPQAGEVLHVPAAACPRCVLHVVSQATPRLGCC